MKVKYTKIRNANYNISNLKNSSKIKKPKRFTKAINFKTSKNKNYKKKTKNKRGGASWLNRRVDYSSILNNSGDIKKDESNFSNFSIPKKQENLKKTSENKEKFIIKKRPLIANFMKLKKLDEAYIEGSYEQSENKIKKGYVDILNELSNNELNNNNNENLFTFLEYTIEAKDTTGQHGGRKFDATEYGVIQDEKVKRIQALIDDSVEQLEKINSFEDPYTIVVFKDEDTDYLISITEFKYCVDLADMLFNSDYILKKLKELKKNKENENNEENLEKLNVEIQMLTKFNAFSDTIKKYFLGYQKLYDIIVNAYQATQETTATTGENKSVRPTEHELSSILKKNGAFQGGGEDKSETPKDLKDYANYLNQCIEKLEMQDIYHYLYNFLIKKDATTRFTIGIQKKKFKWFLEDDYEELRTNFYQYLKYIENGRYLEILEKRFRDFKYFWKVGANKINEEAEIIKGILNNDSIGKAVNLFWFDKTKLPDDTIENYEKREKHFNMKMDELSALIKKYKIKPTEKGLVNNSYLKDERINRYFYFGNNNNNPQFVKILYNHDGLPQVKEYDEFNKKMVEGLHESGVMPEENKLKFLYQINLIANKCRKYSCLYWFGVKVAITAATLGAISGIEPAADAAEAAVEMSIHYRETLQHMTIEAAQVAAEAAEVGAEVGAEVAGEVGAKVMTDEQGAVVGILGAQVAFIIGASEYHNRKNKKKKKKKNRLYLFL